MKHLIFAGLLLAIIGGEYTIGNSNHVYDSPVAVKVTLSDTTIAGNWYLMPVMPSDTAAGKIPQIKFDLSANSFSGNTGCNAMSGKFIIKGDALSFDTHVVSTKMACPGFNEKIFLENLLKTNRYEIKDGILQFMYNTTILSKWSRHTDSLVTKQA